MNIGISKFCEENFFKNLENRNSLKMRILNDVELNWDKQKKGYRDGVVLVPANPEGFFCPLVRLVDGMFLNGKFSPRIDGEEPRKKISVPNVPKTPAKFVDLVLYRKDVLEETHENTGDFEWEIITVLPKIDEDQPMPPDTLMYNHFQLSGGTSTKMTDSEFVEELKKSFVYWKDKAMVYE